MKRRIKIELAFAIILAVAISVSAVYTSMLGRVDNFGFSPRGLSPETMTTNNLHGLSGTDGIQQSVSENIQGEMRKGSFESTVESLGILTSGFGGMVPYLSMAYDNELWSGTLNCKVPTENVTSYTFAVRELISANGTVTHIAISVTETKVNQTGQPEEQLSEVSIGLREVSGGGSPIMDQLGGGVPWLFTGLVWVAEGLIVGVPLCFVCLGVVVMVDRGIIPAWKKQLKGKTTDKATS